MNVKTVGRSGQISIGKALAGRAFVMEMLPNGDILLKHADLMPVAERWLHEPAMKERLARADAWMRGSPPRETALDELETRLGITAACVTMQKTD